MKSRDQSLSDVRLLMYIQRVNLDMLWSLESFTVEMVLNQYIKKAPINIEETLAIFGSNKADKWAEGKKRSRSTDLQKAVALRIDMQKIKREKIKQA